MKRKERIARQIRGEEVDRIPLIGGWNEGAGVIARLAGISTEEYLSDPLSGVIRANKELHVDGMVRFVVPRSIEEIRSNKLAEADFAGHSPEELKHRAEHIADSEEEVLRSRFDAEEVEREYRRYLETVLRQLDGIAFIPTFWEAVADFSLYFTYGYEAFLMATALYPESVERIWWEDSVICRARNRILAALLREYELPPVVFTGHDICYNSGPMCSPGFLRKSYWPHARYSVEPFLDAGIRLIHHCDGNVMPIVDDIVGAGFSGFQGFQYEVGVDPYELASRRGPRGERMLFMAGLSCSRTLPFGSMKDVREEVEFIFDYTDGGKGLLLFTSNVTGAETPAENLRAAYRHAESIGLQNRQRRQTTHRPWPGARIDPGQGDPGQG